MIYGENKWKAIISSYSRENVTRAASMATENQTVWETEKKNNDKNIMKRKEEKKDSTSSNKVQRKDKNIRKEVMKENNNDMAG